MKCDNCIYAPHQDIEFCGSCRNNYTDKAPTDKAPAPMEYHEQICKEIHELYRQKNADYGNSFAEARREIPYYTLGKLHDKFSRYKNLTMQDNANFESIEDTLLDMANYCIMELAERRAEK